MCRRCSSRPCCCKGRTGPTGPTGPTGLAGPTGPTGPSEIQPSARVSASQSTNVPTNTDVPLSFDTVRFDTGGLFNIGTPTRLTAPVSGKYLIQGQARFVGSTTGIDPSGLRELSILLNGVILIAEENAPGLPNVLIDTSKREVATVYELAAGDFVELIAFQSSSVAMTISATPQTSPEFMMIRLSA